MGKSEPSRTRKTRSSSGGSIGAIRRIPLAPNRATNRTSLYRRQKACGRVRYSCFVRS